MKVQKFRSAIEKSRNVIYEAEKVLWEHPETGFNEWKTSRYLEERMEKLGYTLVKAGNIPGFYADFETGKPGPKVLVMAEMDSVLNAQHPKCNPQTYAVHACGHHCQCAALLGFAAALRKGSLEGASGSIRIMFVPAEELIQLEERNEKIRQGIIKCLSGKQEFMLRGYMKGVDLAVHMHTITGEPGTMRASRGFNGNLQKLISFQGKSCHAGGPGDGINALMAFCLGLNAVNAIRDTFSEKDYIRYNMVVTGRKSGGNAIPDLLTAEGTLRASTITALKRENIRINRCLASSAAAIGAQVHLTQLPGYYPFHSSEEFVDIANRVMVDVVGENHVYQSTPGDTSCSDVGDVSALFPTLEAYTSGLTGTFHGDDLYVTDLYSAVILPAVFELCLMQELLQENGLKAKKIMESFCPAYTSIEKYWEEKESFFIDEDLVQYQENGAAILPNIK